MKKTTKRNILSITLVLVGFFLSDWMVGQIGKALRDHLPDYGGKLTKSNYVATRVDKDVIIMGSSRAAHHYVPDILKQNIDSLLDVDYSIYNAGVNGHFLGYNCCWLECLLQRHQPKLLILDMGDSFLYGDNIEVLTDLFPLYDENQIVKRYLDESGLKDRIKLQFNHYRYNSTFVRYLNGYRTSRKVDDGYEPLYGVMSDKQSQEVLSRKDTKIKKVNELSKNRFQSVLRLCREKNVPLIVVTSPRFGKDTPNSLTASLCKENGIPFIDMESSSFFNEHHELFQDAGHLNDEGAKVYTRLFLKELNGVLK